MVKYNKRIVFVYNLFLILFVSILTENAMAAERIDWKGNKPKTGNRLAVLEFSSEGLSTPMRNLITEQFRHNIRKLKMYDVLDSSMTNKVEIFYPGEKVYGECKSRGCIMELGKLLKVNYVITGTINEKKREYFVKGKMYSIDLEQEIHGFSMENVTAVDSVRLEMKKLAYNISGLEVPDTLTIDATNETLSFNSMKIDKKKRRLITLPNIPSKVKSLLYSTVVPGAGQMYSKRTYTGLGIFGAEMIIGGLALLAHSNYQKSWGGFQTTYENYKKEDDPGKLIELRPDIIEYANDTERYNTFLKGLRIAGASVWGLNMLHAYIVGPDDIFVRRGDIGTFADASSKPRMRAWDVLSGFGIRGAILRPFFKGTSLSAFSTFTDGGYSIVTPIGLYFGTVFTSLTYESSNYSFYSSDFEKNYMGTSNTIAFSFDLSKKILFGGSNLRKYAFLGRSSYDDGKGYVVGGDLVYDVSTFPLSFAFISRANIVNTSITGRSMWVTLGVNVGLDIP